VTARCCLACGGRLRVVTLQRHRRRQCPRCGWIFYDNPVPAAVALIVRRGRVLLARRGRPPYAGTWDMPGGFLEAGETPDRALVRELREEIGVGVRRARLVGFALDRYGPRGFPVLCAIYRVTPRSFAVRAADDVSEVRWFAIDRLPWREIAFPGVRRALRRILANGEP
jgi:8-oxo-dGTP diphosphatase